jgi:hypothetical protein
MRIEKRLPAAGVPHVEVTQEGFHVGTLRPWWYLGWRLPVLGVVGRHRDVLSHAAWQVCQVNSPSVGLSNRPHLYQADTSKGTAKGVGTDEGARRYGTGSPQEHLGKSY